MSKINILDESIFNKIAAGEVVEKPASVVKELLDNSIDAKSTKITIKIFDGGISNITITDNGVGIEKDDFDKVFIAHATSKIKTADDLSKIGTLGFRGEALASIASVSKVVLTSKISSDTYANSIKIEGGKKLEQTEVGASDGTTISVSNLFFNVPARAKFLRKARTETSDITNLVERYVLCNPTVSFEYFVDDKLILQSLGTNLFDAIYVVYGKSATDGIINVNYTNENSKIKIFGYIGLPTFSKPNRTYQTLAINGRYITSNLVSTCIFNAYEHYLMKGQFPFYVLNMEIPLDKLDVNVHPNKMEVRFNNTNEIFGNFYNAVSTNLYNCEKITTPNKLITEYKQVTSGVSFSENSSQKSSEIITSNTINENENQNIDSQNQNSATHNFFNSITSNFDAGSQTILKQPENSIMSNIIKTRFEQTMLHNNDKVDVKQENLKTKTDEFFETSDLKFVGTIFATYLIVEKQDKVYIIDEHAGHERLLFDRLVNEIDNSEISKQNLLAPFVLNTNRQEFEFLNENMDKLEKIGFEIKQFGNLSFVVNAIPTLLCDIDLKQFFATVLSDLNDMKSFKNSDLVTRKLMQHSCKCAVRAGKILSSGEVNSLIKQMKDEKMQLQCPHGRPVVSEISKLDLEKLFKRIA